MPSAAILCGGRASRFGGSDKSALVVDGRSILNRQIDVLTRLTTDILLVRGQNQAAPQTAPKRLRIVVDRVSDKGPLGGLDAALAAARDHTVIVVACDMPFVDAALLRHLAGLAAGHDVVVPRTVRGYHPLCAVYTRACAAPIARRLAAGQLTMIGLLDEMRTRVVDADELERFGDPDHLLSNVNTPDDFQNLANRQDHRR